MKSKARPSDHPRDSIGGESEGERPSGDAYAANQIIDAENRDEEWFEKAGAQVGCFAEDPGERIEVGWGPDEGRGTR